uniref:Estrogen-related receptor gamma-like n=1 Tax=Stegastes partitus TaxID=144197 RepID=A0A3B5B234_9TELE
MYLVTLFLLLSLLDSSSSSSSSSPTDEARSPASFPLSPCFPPASSSSSSSYSLVCGAPEPDSPTGSSSSSAGASASETSARFSMTDSFSPLNEARQTEDKPPDQKLFSLQVDSILRGDYLTPMAAVGPKRLCLVCGDFASGYHYGVASCEACKAFFKRTIQGNIEYSCPVMNECEITKRRRKACQACRFQKCLQAGMMREGTSVRQKNSHEPLQQGLGLTLTSPVISHLLLTEPAPLAANQDDSTNDGSLRTLLTLCDLLNRELLVLIGWAKQIPGFSGLSLVDQMSLLQSGWMEALLVGVAWRSQGAPGEELVFAGNLRLDESQCRAAGLADVYEALRHLTARYEAMKLSPEEVVTLKAMALSLCGHLESLVRFQDGLHEALQDLEATRREQNRAGRLLMSLPLLRQTADRAVQNLLRLHRSRRVPLHKLLLEMLDAKA